MPVDPRLAALVERTEDHLREHAAAGDHAWIDLLTYRARFNDSAHVPQLTRNAAVQAAEQEYDATIREAAGWAHEPGISVDAHPPLTALRDATLAWMCVTQPWAVAA